MATNKITCCIFCFAILSLYSTCRKRFNCSETVYRLSTFLKCYPDHLQVTTGDTLWLQYDAPVQLKDNSSQTQVDYSGAENLSIVFAFLELKGGTINNPGSVPAVDAFDYIRIIGDSIPSTLPTQVKEFLVKENAGRYQLKIGGIPKRKGAFILGPQNSANVYRKRDRCTKAMFEVQITDTDRHLELYAQSRPGYILSHYDSTHLYCFTLQ